MLGHLRGFCLAWYSLDVFFTASTIIHLCTISIDRYLALRNPLKSCHQKRKRSLIIQLLCAWLIPFGIACPLFILALRLDKTDLEESFKGCGPNNAYFILIATIVTFFVPLVIMTMTYILTVANIRSQLREAENNLYNDAFASLVVRPKMAAFINKKSSSNDTKDNSTDLMRSLSTQSKTTFFGVTRISNRKSDNSCKKDPNSKACSDKTSFELDNVHLSKLSINSINNNEPTENQRLLSPSCPSSPRIDSDIKRGKCSSTSSSPTKKEGTVLVNPVGKSHLTPCGYLRCSTGKMPAGWVPSRRTAVPVRHSTTGELQGPLCRTPSKTSSMATSTKENSTVRKKRSDNEKRISQISRSKKAIQTLGILFLLFLICFLPFFVTYLLDFFCVACRKTTTPVLLALEWVGYSASMLNPFVYYIFNPTFRRTYGRLMHLNCRKFHYLSSQHIYIN